MEHLRCAAFELPFREGEEFGSGNTAELLEYLEQHGVVHREAGRWHWMADSADRLSRFPIAWPAVSLTLLASLLQWLALIAILAGLYWLGAPSFPDQAD